MSELLARIELKDGSGIELFRETQGLRLCHKDHCFTTSIFTARQTMELFSLLESLGESVSYPEEQPHDNDQPAQPAGP